MIGQWFLIFEPVDFHGMTILATKKKTQFVFVVVNFNEKIIVGCHL